MHVRVIFRLLSVLSLIVCIFCFPCFCVAVGYAEIEAARAFILSIAVLAVPAALIIYFTQRTDSRMISSRDGYLLVFMAWLGASFFASFPFYLSESLPTLADSFFEAASGISTTGATVIPDLDIMPRSILLWRSVNHWLGGMGIVVLSVALLPLLGIGGVQLVKAESSGLDEARITSRVTQTAKYLWLIYISFTFICFILLFAGGMSVFDAVNHAFSTMASGGFSTKNLSIGFYASPYIHWVIIGSMIVAGGSFIFYYRLFTGQFKKIFHSSELRAYLFIIMTVGLAVSAFNYYYGIYAGIEANLRYGFFQVVSLLTTTGFFTTDYTFWFPIVQFMLFCLLFVGGCTGSTAGGFKVMRVVILLKQAVNEMKRLVHPRGIFLLRLNGASVSKDIVYSVFGFFFLYIFSVIAVAAVSSAAGLDLLTAFSTGFAIIGNVGPGFGGVGPSHTFAFYPDYAKWVLGLGMLVGRLELYTFFVLLMPFFWKR